MKENRLDEDNLEAVQNSQQNETADKSEPQETTAKEKTPEELALEAGYYASCFRSH